MPKINQEEYECLYCGRQLNNGEEVLLIDGEEEFACLNCVKEGCFSIYKINGAIIATENDCEFRRIIYGE